MHTLEQKCHYLKEDFTQTGGFTPTTIYLSLPSYANSFSKEQRFIEVREKYFSSFFVYYVRSARETFKIDMEH